MDSMDEMDAVDSVDRKAARAVEMAGAIVRTNGNARFCDWLRIVAGTDTASDWYSWPAARRYCYAIRYAAELHGVSVGTCAAYEHRLRQARRREVRDGLLLVAVVLVAVILALAGDTGMVR